MGQLSKTLRFLGAIDCSNNPADNQTNTGSENSNGGDRSKDIDDPPVNLTPHNERIVSHE